MTISTTESKISYNGNGTTTVFAFPYRFLANGDLVVIRVAANGTETTLVLNTDYTVTGADSDDGGSITCTVAPASGARLVIYRSVALTQETDYISGDAFPAETHERALDRLTMISQQLQEGLDRSAKLPVTSTADADALVADLIRLADSADNIDTVAGSITNINAVAGNATNINAVAGNVSNISAVAGNATNINAVNANSTNINTVASDLLEPVSEINTVAVDIANVNTVGTNIANVNTVAGISGNVTTVAGIQANVTTVAGISAAVSNVSSISSAITSVNSNETNINAVAGNATNINAVAGNTTNINAVNANSTNINAVASDLLEPVSEINTVATDIANVNTVGTNIANVNTVAGISGNVTTVAGIAANVTTVAGNTTNINAVAGNATNINTVAGISADVTTVSSNIVDIQNAEENATAAIAAKAAAEAARDAALAAFDSFDDRYLGQKANDPTLDNDGNALITGALYFNTVDDVMKVYEGSIWVAAYASLSGALLSANNLSDLTNTATARTNLGLSSATQAEMEAGTETLLRAMSPLRVKQAIAANAPQAFPSGTRLLFQQTAAPTGWTKDTTHNDKALRVVSGTASSGGSVAFSTAFASQTPTGTVSVSVSAGTLAVSTGTLAVGSTTLSTTQIPSHTHTYNGGSNGCDATGPGFRDNQTFYNTGATGGGGSHNHSLTGSPTISGAPTVTSATFSGSAINLAVQYVDLIIASKD